MGANKIGGKYFIEGDFNGLGGVYTECTSGVKNIFEKVGGKKDQKERFYKFVDEYKKANIGSEIYMLDQDSQTVIINNKIYKILFSFTANYIKQLNWVDVGTVPYRYDSIKRLGDGSFSILIEGDETIICDYIDGSFQKNIPSAINQYISTKRVIKNVSSQEELKGIFTADIDRIKLGGFFYLNSCFPRTMLMLDYCKTHDIGGNLIIDIYKTNKPGYNPNDISSHFALQIDGVGAMQFIGDSNGGKYQIDDEYKFDDNGHKSSQENFVKIPFDQITGKDNIISILNKADPKYKNQIIGELDKRMEQLYNYHKSTLPK